LNQQKHFYQFEVEVWSQSLLGVCIEMDLCNSQQHVYMLGDSGNPLGSGLNQVLLEVLG